MDDPVTLYLQSLDSNHSIDNISRVLARFVQRFTKSPQASMYDMPWSELTYRELSDYRQELIKQDKAPDTVSTYLSYIKGVMRIAATVSTIDPNKRIPHSTYVEVAQNIKPPKRSGELANRYIPLDEFHMMMETTDEDTPTAKRDKALLHILYGCGLRRSELVELQYPDSINWQAQHIVVKGKGNKRRHVPLFSDLEATIEDYLFARGEHRGPLFHRVSKSDRLLLDTSLTSRGVVDIIKRRCIKAGIEVYNAHSFRASFATTHFLMGTDLMTIQNLMGHSSPTTTQRYDLRDAHTSAEAMEKLGERIARRKEKRL